MTEFVAPFYGVYEAFKSPAEKLIPILDFLNFKTAESMGYDVVH